MDLLSRIQFLTEVYQIYLRMRKLYSFFLTGRINLILGHLYVYKGYNQISFISS